MKTENTAAHAKISDVLNHIEAILISAGEPTHNLQSGRFGPKVGRYLQYRDKENIGPEMIEAIHEIFEDVKATRNAVREIAPRGHRRA